MPNRANDWMTQAERNLEMAATSAKAVLHEWACFGAQQAAEAAVKALHQSRGQEAGSQLVRQLLESLPPAISVPAGLLDDARALDLHYLSARYPSGHVRGSAGENYGPLQSREAIAHARQIVEFCRLQMAQS